jgi:Rrf2 family protein
MLSNTCKYAVRAVIYVSVYTDNRRKAGIKEISSKLDIPPPFLGKILQALVKHKILHSTKGPGGGFSLAREAEEITVMDIVEVIDGTSFFDTCLIRTTKCSDEEPCALHDNVTASRKLIRNMFTQQSIADLSSEFRRDTDRIRI